MPSNIPLMTIVVHVPEGEDRRIPITEWRTAIGRSSKNDIKIVSKQVSKVHAAIEISDGEAFVRDLGSRNGVEVNGYPIGRSRRLEPGDVITLGDATMTVDPNSQIFRPADSKAVLQLLLAEEAEIRAREQVEGNDERRRSQTGRTVNEGAQNPRRSVVLVGRPVATGSGDVPVLRTLRITDNFGPRDAARIEAFVLETERGERVWIHPRGDVHVASLDRFALAPNVWIDEPEDFSDARQAAVLQRTTYYLPTRLKVAGAAENGIAGDGLTVFTEASGVEPMVFGPAD
jgi:hypothetical protein